MPRQSLNPHLSPLEGSGADGTVVTTIAGSDIDGDTVTYAITSGNELGYIAIDAGTGEVTLTADGATALNNDALTSTSTTIGVTISDGTLSSSEALLEIKFDAQNDAPTTSDDSATVIAGGLVTITAGNGVLANDADVDSPLSVESVVLTTSEQRRVTNHYSGAERGRSIWHAHARGRRQFCLQRRSNRESSATRRRAGS